MNIPWLLAAAGASESRKGELNIPWLFAAASSSASRGKVEQGYASLPSKLKVQHDSEAEEEEEEKIKSEDQPVLGEQQKLDQLEKKNDKEEEIEKWAIVLNPSFWLIFFSLTQLSN